MSDQDINDVQESHNSQPQWLPNGFMVGEVSEEGDCFFDALAQGMNLLSIRCEPFNVKSLRQACFDYAKDHQDWHQVIVDNAKMGGYATSEGPEADFDSYLARIQLTVKEMSILKAGPAIQGRANVEGCMLCQRYDIKLHVIEKHTKDGQEVIIHQLVEISGLTPISVDENLYNKPGIIHILNEGEAHFVPLLHRESIKKQVHSSLLEGAGSQQSQINRTVEHLVQLSAPDILSSHMLSLSDPSTPERKLDHNGEEEISSKRTVGLTEETETFQASGAKSLLHGVAYQWKLLMLFAQRCQRLDYNFRLATEMDAAETFDDVVLQYVKQGTDVQRYRFLQAKHSQENNNSKKITAMDLLTKKNADFSLQKYFISYQKIKRRFLSGELQDFIICTNKNFDFDGSFRHQSLKKLHHNKQPLYLESVTEADDMLIFGGERYRLVSATHSEREDVVSKLKSLFEETSEWRRLAKMLAKHLVEDKAILLHGLFKDYYRPLALCVFNIRDNELVKEFVEGKFDDKLCPGAHDFRKALREEIQTLNNKPTKQCKPQTMEVKMTDQETGSDDFWNDIGKRKLKFAEDFKRGFVLHPKPQLSDPTALAKEIAHLINKKAWDETINIQQEEETIINKELHHLVGHVFVREGENVVFSNEFQRGSGLAGNIPDLWNTLLEVLAGNKCQEMTLKLSSCTFRIADTKVSELKGLIGTKPSFLALQVTDKEVEEFLDHLIFAVNQPNEMKLGELIRQELGDEFNLIDADLITSDFQSRILDWLKEKQGSYQSEKTMGKVFSDLQEKFCQLILLGLTSEHVATLQKYGLQFSDSVLPAALKEFLNSSHPEVKKSIFNFTTDPKQTFLGSIKVYQVMKDIDKYKSNGSFIFIRLNSLLLLEEKALMAFRKELSDLLIVEYNGEPNVKIQRLYGQLSEILKNKPGKKVILIGPETHPLAAEFKTGKHETQYQEMVDEFKFGDLTTDSQTKLLETTVKFQGNEIIFNKLLSAEFVSADSTLTQLLPLVNLLEGKKLEIGQPLSVSNGYDEGYYIERTFNYTGDENSTSSPSENLEKLLLQAQHPKVILISDTAGMGKTTVLTHMAKQIKQNFPSHWVVRIELNDHTDALKAIDKQNIGAVEFLSKKLLKLESPFENELFEQYLKKGKVVLMLDGFDEVCPSYEETVLDILKALKETSVEQLWVTTRPHMRKKLENNLCQQSYTLEPFSKSNQVEFLTKFWHKKLNLKGLNHQQLEMYATALIEKLERSISDRDKEFTAVPLQTRLLAEGFHRSDITGHKLPDKLDLLDLYKRFIEGKYDIYQKEKIKIKASTVAAQEQQKRDYLIFTQEHQRLAVQVLFPKAVVVPIKDDSQSVFPPEQIARIGIVQYVHNKPHFIHRTFAEYYIADFLVNQLTKESTPTQELQEFLLKDILLKENYQVICSFLDGLLGKEKPSRETLEQFGKRIHELQTDIGDGVDQSPLRSERTVLHKVAQEGHTHIVRYLLDSLQAGQYLETLNHLLLAKDNNGHTAWHLSAESGYDKTLEELWNRAKKASVNLKDSLLLAKDKNSQTVWHQVAWNYHTEVLKNLLKFAETELSQQELKDMLLAKDMEKKTVWHLAAWENCCHVLETLTEWAEKTNLRQQEFKAALQDKDDLGRTPWQLGTLNNHPEVYEWVKVIKAPQEQKGLLKELFLHKDNNGQTIWHLAARSNHPEAFKKLLSVAEETLSQKELIQLLLTKDTVGQTAWHLAAGNGRAESLSMLWEWVKTTHSDQTKKHNWLFSEDSNGTVWHLAAQRGHISVLKILWEWAKEEGLNLKDFLLVTDTAGRTAWHLAADTGNIEILVKIFDWAKETKLNLEEDLLMAKDRSGRTAFQLVMDSLIISEVIKSQILQ